MTKDQEIKENVRKTKIVEAGKTLFFKYGYRKVTVEEICKEAGVSKMTFYRFFENKLDLVKFIIIEISNDGMNRYEEIRNMDASFEEKTLITIEMKEQAAAQYSEEFLKDVYEDKISGVMPLLQKLSGEIMIKVMDDYRKAQEEGAIRKDLNLSFIPYFMNQINNMVKDPALLGLYQGNIREVMKELTNFFFYGILVPDKKLKNEK